MSKFNSNFNIQLSILSPVHIGSGTEKNWQRGLDFVHTNDQVLWLDIDRLMHTMSEQEVNTYMGYLERGNMDVLEDYLTKRFDLEEYARQSFRYESKFHGKEIRALIRDGLGSAYIPGSSIKGAIASALFAFLYRQTAPKYYNNQTFKELYGDFSRSLGRFIRPSDSGGLNSEISDLELFNLYRKGTGWESDKKSDFSIIVETFVPEQHTALRLTLADGLGKLLAEWEPKQQKSFLPTYYKPVFGENPLGNLFKIINESTVSHLNKEIAFFKTYNEYDKTAEVVEQLETLRNQVAECPPQRKCILRMAYGSGFHAITGDWRFSDHASTLKQPDSKNLVYSRHTRQKEPALYKSRRIAFPYAESMGFVALEVS
jgi:hypothetical protein